MCRSILSFQFFCFFFLTNSISYSQLASEFQIDSIDNRNLTEVYVYYTGQLESYLKLHLSTDSDTSNVGIDKYMLRELDRRRVYIIKCNELPPFIGIGLLHPTTQLSNFKIIEPDLGQQYFFLVDLDSSPTSDCEADMEKSKNETVLYYQKRIESTKKYYYSLNRKKAKKINLEKEIKASEDLLKSQIALYDLKKQVGCVQQVDKVLFEKSIRSNFEYIQKITLEGDGFHANRSIKHKEYLLNKLKERTDSKTFVSSLESTWYILTSDSEKNEVNAISSSGNKKVTNAIVNKGELISGQLIDYSQNSISSGNFVKWRLNGHGVKETNGWLFSGNFSNGRLDGHGSLSSPDGMYYVGDFINGKFDGEGKIDMKDGRWYEGSFKKGLFHGKGIYFNGGTAERVEYYEGSRVDQAYQISTGTNKDSRTVKKGRRTKATQSRRGAIRWWLRIITIRNHCGFNQLYG